MSRTPVTKAGLEQFDSLAPIDAVLKAWTYPGLHPLWHRAMQRQVRKSMPLLARALDRLAYTKPSKPGAPQ